MTEINLSDISIGFIGLGKLGLPCAEVFAQHHPVYGYDVVDYNSSVINKCEDIESVVKQSDYVFIAVPTPHAPGYGGETPTSHLKPTDFDYGIVDSVIKEAVKYTADTDTVLVLISTVLPGTISERWQDDLKGTTFIYNPYLIAMGTVAHDMVNPEMIMIGTADGETTDQAEVLAAMYKNMAEVDNLRIEYGTHTEIEALKVFYNTWITMKVTLCNMVQDVANAAGNMNVDVVTIDSTTATATLQAALVSNTAAQKGLDKADDTVDDATDAKAGAVPASSIGVSTKNELDLVTTE